MNANDYRDQSGVHEVSSKEISPASNHKYTTTHLDQEQGEDNEAQPDVDRFVEDDGDGDVTFLS